MNKLTAVFFAMLATSAIASDKKGIEPVSMVQLIVNPESFIENRVLVSGYIPRGPNMLFISKESASMLDASSGILLEFRHSDECVFGRVTLEGVFKKRSMYFISNITNIYSHDNKKNCELIELKNKEE